MADEHIDYLEVFEYGDHFLVEIDKLDGLTNIVNIAAAILIKLGRKDELRLFFNDLQVNESSKSAPANTTTEGT